VRRSAGLVLALISAMLPAAALADQLTVDDIIAANPSQIPYDVTPDLQVSIKRVA
jgi:hypothetical protein